MSAVRGKTGHGREEARATLMTHLGNQPVTGAIPNPFRMLNCAS